jgi:hypothetical protein
VAKEFPRLDELLRGLQHRAGHVLRRHRTQGGRINLSPTGYRDTFAVLDDHTVAYPDPFGSGAETIAHLRDNGRINHHVLLVDPQLADPASDWQRSGDRPRMTPNSAVSSPISAISVRASEP